ncbi:MAG: hypothetical protein C0606_08065 [Hyphomicrobiales bacterium]|nr:MAG: hypothetical protein C0606_08065 [Hyphomicrobiales bacterium]
MLRRTLLIWLAAAFLWSAAEAFLFFVVADVLLTLIALRFGLRTGLVAAVVGTLGALVGAAALYGSVNAAPEAMFYALLALPAIDATMLENARTAMQAGPMLALLEGAVTGVPFKVFAALAPQVPLSLGAFLIMGFVARLSRYAGAVFLAALVAALFPSLRTSRTGIVLWAMFWIVFYALFWGPFGPA